MAKTSSIEREKKRRRMAQKYSGRRTRLKALINDRALSPEERFQAQLKLNEIPKNASPVRLHNRCLLTGRSKAVYRKFRVSRIKFRELASCGKIPGVVKSSW